MLFKQIHKFHPKIFYQISSNQNPTNYLSTGFNPEKSPPVTIFVLYVRTCLKSCFLEISLCRVVENYSVCHAQSMPQTKAGLLGLVSKDQSKILVPGNYPLWHVQGMHQAQAGFPGPKREGSSKSQSQYILRVIITIEWVSQLDVPSFTHNPAFKFNSKLPVFQQNLDSLQQVLHKLDFGLFFHILNFFENISINRNF